MSIPSSRVSVGHLVVGWVALVEIAAGLGCKKADQPVEQAPTAAAPGAPAGSTAAPLGAGALGKGIDSRQGSLHRQTAGGDTRSPRRIPFVRAKESRKRRWWSDPGGGLKNVLVRVTQGAARQL
jgi:hypothetical protein